jgi:heme exporter protein D
MSLPTTALSLPTCPISEVPPYGGSVFSQASSAADSITYGTNTAPTRTDIERRGASKWGLESLRYLLDLTSVLGDGSTQLPEITIDKPSPVIEKVSFRVVYSVEDPGTEQVTLKLPLNPNLTGERRREAIQHEIDKALAAIASRLVESHPGATFLVVFDTSLQKKEYSSLPANFRAVSLEDDEGNLSSTLKDLLRSLYSHWPEATLALLCLVVVIVKREEKQRDALIQEFERRRARDHRAEKATAMEAERLIRDLREQLKRLSGGSGPHSTSRSE